VGVQVLGVVEMTSQINPPTPVHIIYAMYEYYADGNSLKATGKKFGLTASGVMRGFKRHGLHVRSRSHALYTHYRLDNDSETRAMYADYQAGMSLRQIGKKWNYSDSTIHSRFKARGFRCRTHLAHRKEFLVERDWS
jgi:hypothetical protein